MEEIKNPCFILEDLTHVNTLRQKGEFLVIGLSCKETFDRFKIPIIIKGKLKYSEVENSYNLKPEPVHNLIYFGKGYKSPSGIRVIISSLNCKKIIK